MNVYTSLTQLIGNTPLLELCNLEKQYGLEAKLIAKLEYWNPLGSSKDRSAYAMILEGERQGRIRPGTVLIEPTSGNTGVGLAFVCALRGYRLILTMPESMSPERRILLAALGVEIELTPGHLGMKGAIDRANQLRDELPDTFLPMQFENPANPAVHEQTTAQEIWRDTGGAVDMVVAAFGTGGTLSGVARGLKAHKPAVRAVGVEPAASAVVSGGPPGMHKIQGIGAGFIPKTLDLSVVDEILPVSDADAYSVTRELAAVEGLVVGISSGAATHAAVQLARRPENKGKTIVVILPDSGERYLSTGVFPSTN